jgi:DNA-binding transcriptional LysR family regulator
MVLACPVDHILGTARSVTLSELNNETFVDFHGECGARWANDAAFVAAELERRIAFESNDARMLLELVAGGGGVALVPRPLAYQLAGPSGHRVRYVPVDEPAPHWRLGVALRSTSATTAATGALLEMLIEAATAGSKTAARSDEAIVAA